MTVWIITLWRPELSEEFKASNKMLPACSLWCYHFLWRWWSHSFQLTHERLRRIGAEFVWRRTHKHALHVLTKKYPFPCGNSNHIIDQRAAAKLRRHPKQIFSHRKLDFWTPWTPLQHWVFFLWDTKMPSALEISRLSHVNHWKMLDEYAVFHN